MGQHITLRARNDTGDADEFIFIQLLHSKVRIRNGWWAKFSYRRESYYWQLHRGDTMNEAFEMRGRASANRRYKFSIKRHHGVDDVEQIFVYWPSSSAYTRNATVNLGDLEQYFE